MIPHQTTTSLHAFSSFASSLFFEGFIAVILKFHTNLDQHQHCLHFTLRFGINTAVPKHEEGKVTREATFQTWDGGNT
jgi:hypothetical protein